MIKWYKFKNFYSFRDETFVDFVTKKNSSDSHYDVSIDGERISRVISIFGGNGAGKSNLLKPLAFLRWFFIHSFQSMEKDEKLPFYPHKVCENDVTEIEICFIESITEHKHEYKYLLKMNRERVLLEELKIKSSRLFSKIFSREYNEDENKYEIKTNRSNAFSLNNQELDSIPKNSSAISYLLRKENTLGIFISYLFHAFESNIGFHGKNDFGFEDVIEATETYLEDNELFNTMKSLLIRMDLGIDDIEIEDEEYIDKRTGEVEVIKTPYGIHKCDDTYFKLPMYMESSGTKACYYYLQTVLLALAHGGVAIVDEFDSELHPMMVSEIMQLFMSSSMNKKNAQLIFTSHTPEVLKELRKHQVYLVEKVNGTSENWRLDEVQGLRSQDNLYSKYISGALGGVPDFSL
ncbi:AAA family ATPase [Gallaecimonas xiamenensis]|uniref:Abortive infection protein n=1 Tax=Gallaecimonas xiamenensis 3-C-1 TaxID=745411 RepID=K2JEX0_9GAMM|nr:ATP-binding protein [Gallaecimonas xiamenensis]EKE69144.1 abortive infection protein [Gallaecimonas xiamenensis 3-C-1]